MDQVALPGTSRRSRRGTAVILAVAVAVSVLAVTVAVSALSRSRDGSPAAGMAVPPGMLPWPARGPLANDQAFVDRVVATWDTGNGVVGGGPPPGVVPHPHTEVRVLWAGPVGTDKVAVLQALDDRAQVRLGVFVEQPENSRGQVIVRRRDMLAPDPAQTKQLSVGILRPESTGNSLIVVGRPGVDAVSYRPLVGDDGAGPPVSLTVQDGVAVGTVPPIRQIDVTESGEVLYSGTFNLTAVAPPLK